MDGGKTQMTDPDLLYDAYKGHPFFIPENFKMLSHIIKIQKLKIIMKMYKKYKDTHNFEWKANLDRNIKDSMSEQPFIIAYGKNDSRENFKLGACIYYSITLGEYLVFWYSFDEPPRAIQELRYQSTKFVDIINNLNKNLDPNHDPDVELMEEYDWDL